ncbi:MAG: patatin-like phospholipase family protein [Deltaproteobacteria bacterium]|nr:patatin-like phospholipase family protein [Deltaproteobacteria bacterium]
MGATKAVKEAKEILGGGAADPKTVLDLVKNELKKERAFDYARKILGCVSEDESVKQDRKLVLEIAQQQALCTYKDQNLSVEKRFTGALKILDNALRQRGESLATTKDQETLGQAGAINKYRWEVSGQKKDLEQSLNYYLRGFAEGVANDYGYTAINAAFVLDLLASLESVGIEKSHPVYHAIETRRERARRIREKIVTDVPPLADKPEHEKAKLHSQWWFLVTLGEAYFGLGRYDEAEKWLREAVDLSNVPDWEKESTTRQLAALARIQFGVEVWHPDFEKSPAGGALRVLVGEQALRGILLGKVGLALSGGGFRASFFHIGVLARLAELDMLRHVEVLSCVSGGSIIGAYYYLELRKVLRETRDGDIKPEHYIEIIQRVVDRFFAGVQRNLRTRVAAEFITNIKMIFKPGYSRTQRIGELYEEELFSKVEDGEGETARFIGDMFVHPAEEDKSFSPKLHNWRREAKVPMLILNATTLNTGHNWQFTASWMGEPPANIDAEIDTNYRLRRMFYDDAPKRYKKLRLGYAVAASSCVPGLFEPLSFPGLYPKEERGSKGSTKMTVRLVDGGVHDNQGVASLLEQGCSVMLVSDASGHMEAQNLPSKNIIGVPLRSNDILQSRVREAEYRELDARREASALRGLMFVHLKKDLDAKPVDWIGCQEPPEASDEQRDIARSRPLTVYKVQKDIQESLAAIRTDLDSFSQVEAYALMLSGYRMTAYDFPRAVTGYSSTATSGEKKTKNVKWPFFAVEPAMKREEGHEAEHDELKRLLDAGSSRAFRIWKLYTPLKVTGWILCVAALLTFLWAAWRWADLSILNFGSVGSTVLALLAALIVGKTTVKVVKFRDTLVTIGLGVGMSLFGWLVARLHLHLFDCFFKKYGRVSALAKRVSK